MALQYPSSEADTIHAWDKFLYVMILTHWHTTFYNTWRTYKY